MELPLAPPDSVGSAAPTRVLPLGNRPLENQQLLHSAPPRPSPPSRRSLRCSERQQHLRSPLEDCSGPAPRAPLEATPQPSRRHLEVRIELASTILYVILTSMMLLYFQLSPNPNKHQIFSDLHRQHPPLRCSGSRSCRPSVLPSRGLPLSARPPQLNPRRRCLARRLLPLAPRDSDPSARRHQPPQVYLEAAQRPPLRSRRPPAWQEE